MTAPPVVSVIVPTRNRAPMLRAAVSSVLAQRDVRLELIVVDEASSDETPQFLAELATRDNRLHIVRHDQPRLLPGARNAGARLASGEWLAFLDDDDAWHPDKLRRQLDLMQQEGTHWCYSSAVLMDRNMRSVAIQPAGGALALSASNVVPGGGSGVVMRRALFAEAGCFDESLVAAEDWDLWIRLAQSGSPSVMDAALVGYRVSAGSMSHQIDRMKAAHDQVRSKHPHVSAPLQGTELTVQEAAYMALQLARAGERRASIQTLFACQPIPKRHVVLAVWVFATGQAWERPRWLRDRTSRHELRAADRWLSQLAKAAAAS